VLPLHPLTIITFDSLPLTPVIHLTHTIPSHSCFALLESLLSRISLLCSVDTLLAASLQYTPFLLGRHTLTLTAISYTIYDGLIIFLELLRQAESQDLGSRDVMRHVTAQV
jgi:hypothetical protein